MTKSQQIKSAIKKNPKISTAELAKKFKCSSALVYQIKKPKKLKKTKATPPNGIIFALNEVLFTKEQLETILPLIKS